MTAVEALKNGTSLIAETTTNAAGELADTARRLADHQPQGRKGHRRGRLLLGIAVLGAGAAWMSRRTSFGRRLQDQVIDLGGRSRANDATVEGLAS